MDIRKPRASSSLLSILVLVFLMTAETTPGMVLLFQSNTTGKNLQQTTAKTTGRVRGGMLVLATYSDIPAATELCAPDACEWWSQVRTTGNALNKKNDKKLRTKFLQLLREGQKKSYRVPLIDRPPQVLGNYSMPTYPESVQGKVTGLAAVSIEFRADGSVGEVQIVKGLGLGIDDRLITAARKSVFLPAVQNGAFVTSHLTATAEFQGHSPFSSRH